jgi:glycosyltransferase involved in cell wall biosynthesis
VSSGRPPAGRRVIRVTYVVPSLELAGAERQLVSLANSLDRCRFEPTIVCIGPNPLALEELAADVRVRYVPLGRIRRQRRLRRLARGALLAPALALELTRRRPEIVHAYLPSAYVVAGLVAQSLRIPLVIAGRRSLMSIEAYRHGLWRWSVELANRAIDFHVCNSEAARQMTLLTEQVEASRTTVIHNGAGLPDITHRPPPLPAAWAVGRRDLGAVSLANLFWHKGHAVLLRATAEVVKRLPGFRLVLVGEGPERGRIEALVRELGLGGNVVLAGSVGQASGLLRNFQFSVLASVQESFPNAVVESMAAGVPVVATRVGGVPELVREEVDGLLVPAGEPGALAAAMLRLLREPELAERMGRAARERIRESFSIEKMVRETEDLYLSLLGSLTANEGGEG